MKLAVLNTAGDVGKNTMALHPLAPRIPRCEVIAGESVDADDT